MNTTNHTKAKCHGKYHIFWHKARQLDQNTRSLALCRYWPEIHRMRSDGFLGIMLEIGPAKVKVALQRDPTLARYELQLNLWKARLVGPFDFETVSTNNGKEESHWIPMVVWSSALKEVAKDRQISIENIELRPKGLPLATAVATTPDNSTTKQPMEATNKRQSSAPIRADNNNRDHRIYGSSHRALIAVKIRRKYFCTRRGANPGYPLSNS
jgi:hypothetical protein